MRRIIPSIVLIWLILALCAPAASAAPAYTIDMGSGEHVDALAFTGDKLYIAYSSAANNAGTRYAVSTRGYYGNHIHYFEAYSGLFRENDGKQSRLKPNCMYVEDDFIYAWCWRYYEENGVTRANNVLAIFSETGSVMSEYVLDSVINKTDTLIAPKAMAGDGMYLYLADPAGGNVLKVTEDGRLIAKYSSVAAGIAHPDVVELSGGRLIISDSSAGKTIFVTKDFKNATAYPFGIDSLAIYGDKYASVEGNRLVVRNNSLGVLRTISPSLFGAYIPLQVDVYDDKVAILARANDGARPDSILVYDAQSVISGNVTPPEITPTPSLKPTPSPTSTVSPSPLPAVYCCPGPLGLILYILSWIPGFSI